MSYVPLDKSDDQNPGHHREREITEHESEADPEHQIRREIAERARCEHNPIDNTGRTRQLLSCFIVALVAIFLSGWSLSNAVKQRWFVGELYKRVFEARVSIEQSVLQDQLRSSSYQYGTGDMAASDDLGYSADDEGEGRRGIARRKTRHSSGTDSLTSQAHVPSVADESGITEIS
ncbi:hypothetical protein M011DRAFT_474378 [Sporormia fimetaria CBS 119925]|uniref:Uncharacterized protein n=1 Tax=Sporormia fimetaria CBS 119925 TaxID=1340428 RepID=A0A6A6VMV3_9PLEO|nr:hypothetical protein M011DRAFT_474378 [Sporormia fimetaria CBS 119925]